ncbi:MAG: hypothetical protein WCD20_04825 [Rhodomicrobium sp.]
MSWDGVKKGAGAGFPEPPKAADSTLQVVSRPDGRTARATGRTKQFNPKVRPQFMERFAEAQAREEEELGERVTQAYFLELLLARYEKDHGKSVGPFGLSEAALAGAEAIAEKMKWDLSQVVEDAIAARCRELDLAKTTKKRTITRT